MAFRLKEMPYYAWIETDDQQVAPDGKAGFVLANGALSTSTKEEYAIRKAILEADKIDAIVALPGQMFYSTQIPNFFRLLI